MTDELLDDIERRFADMETEKMLFLSTLLDPRYKDRLLRDEHRTKASKMLMQEMLQLEQANPPVPSPSDDQGQQAGDIQSQSKRRRVN